ncbi:MAG: hypothetical protein ABI539_09685 [Acidobacteriota bacterium]
MKQIPTLLMALLFAFLSGSATLAQSDGDKGKDKKSPVITKYDKGKDITTVRLKQFPISRLSQEKDAAPNFPLHQMDLEVSYNFKGQNSGPVIDGVTFKFHASAGNYLFLRETQVNAVLDRDSNGMDRVIQLGMSDYKSEPPKFNSVYEEYLTVSAPAEAVEKIAKANSIELFVGPVGYRLSASQIEAIKALAASLPK